MSKSYAYRGRPSRAHLTVSRFQPVPDDTKRVRVNVRAVPCPDCKAEVGDCCTNADGAQMRVVHRSRHRMAVRLRNEQLANPKEETPKEYPYPTVVCVVCNKTVRVILAQFSNQEHGVRYKETLVHGAHQALEHKKARAGTSMPCQMAYLPVDTSKIIPPKESNT